MVKLKRRDFIGLIASGITIGSVVTLLENKRYSNKEVKISNINSNLSGSVLMQSSYSILNSKNIKYMLRL